MHTFEITHRINFMPDKMITHGQGMKLIRELLSMPDSDVYEGNIVIRYTGMIKKSKQFFYQYTVSRKPDFDNAELNLLVNTQTGTIVDSDFNSGNYSAFPVSGELRNQAAELVNQSSNFTVSSGDSLMILLEDFRFNKTLKVEAFKDKDMKDGVMLLIRLEYDNGVWKLAEEINETQQEPSPSKRENPNKFILINHDEYLNHPIGSDSGEINTDSLDEAIIINELYPAVSGLKYDFNGNGQTDTLTYRETTHKRSGYALLPFCREFELQLGDGYLYYQLFSDPFSEYMSDISIVGICDINKNDSYVEFHVITETNNGVRWNTNIYRLNENNEIVRLAFLDSSILGVSGDGKVYYWGGNLVEERPFNPDYALSYYDIELGDFVSTSQIIGKTFTDIHAIIFENSEDVPTGAPAVVTLEFPGAIRYIKENEPVTILEIGSDKAKIRTEDGLIGWIGGFHMVWD
jgi:hypothetical protein